MSQTEWTLDSEGIWVFTHEPARTRGRPDTLFSTPHIKHGQNGKLTGAPWSQVKPSDFKMGKKKKKKTCFLLNRPAITALRLVFHSDHVWCVVYAIPTPGTPAVLLIFFALVNVFFSLALRYYELGRPKSALKLVKSNLVNHCKLGLENWKHCPWHDNA